MTSPLYAVIDLGSNSFHMLITRQLADSVQIVDKIKRKVRLASGLNTDNMLSDEAIERGLECMRFFAERLQDFPKQNIRVVATATLRLAKNRDVFIEQANQILGHNIQLLSGVEEAKTIYKGVAYTSNIQGNKLVFDIGGASTEIIIGENVEPLKAMSLDIGCVTFNQTFFNAGALTLSAFELATAQAKLHINSVISEYQGLTFDVVLGGSGTMQALAEILMHQQKPTLIDYEFLCAIKQQLIACKTIDAISIGGLDGERIPVFASGLAILIALFEVFEVKTLRLSSGALREGLLYDMLPSAKTVDIAALTINSMMVKYHVEQQQSERVTSIAQQLFNGCVDHWPAIVNDDYFVVNAACQLHEIGLLIDFKNQQKHGAYIVNNSQMLGFDQSQKQTLAMLIAQQKSDIDLQYLASQLLPLNTCASLLAIVRLAILLASRRHDKHLPTLTLISDVDSLTLGFEHAWLASHPLIADELRQEVKQFGKLGIKLNVNT
ncbi:guanosine-5'-triphosphate,3'-diphosphate pyrophosphatase [Thalassotalea sp. LPB0316]|uniref:Ppx/GppA phosphatase family protein n=1 Tax=Thalassotalea sp. LPB0316 TaxID=2769490 RepID=UPI0018672730|nr:guanosine-5'-triphosphate,3'-diphosphate pyrophosphatase [Thalassotalea sp. LPB0316]QOL26312.1 guanosine-5'-triphosphate,3'-diphosphate pyrophosphatase [Thalassotalea sp. LPB0316]